MKRIAHALITSVSFLGAVVCTTNVALSADAVVGSDQEIVTEVGRNLRFELGGGISVDPTYEGSSDYELSPLFIGRFVSLSTPTMSFGGTDTRGFSIGPSFRYLSERESNDDISLAGTNDIDASLELGLKVGYEWDYIGAFVATRYGVTGHNGIVGEAGIDAILRPTEATRITIGPRVSFANSDYMDTYFSVGASAINLAPYQADGGFKTVGAEIALRHDFNERWAIETGVKWDRFVGDAADSPIVKAGSDDQLTAKLGLVRKFSIDF